MSRPRSNDKAIPISAALTRQTGLSYGGCYD